MRKSVHLTVQELRDLVFQEYPLDVCSTKHLHGLERGSVNCSQVLLGILADVLGCTTDALLGRVAP